MRYKIKYGGAMNQRAAYAEDEGTAIEIVGALRQSGVTARYFDREEAAVSEALAKLPANWTPEELVSEVFAQYARTG